MSKKFAIEEKLLLEVLNYLATRPYGEIFKLIAVLQNLEQIKEQPDVVVPDAQEQKTD